MNNSPSEISEVRKNLDNIWTNLDKIGQKSKKVKYFSYWASDKNLLASARLILSQAFYWSHSYFDPLQGQEEKTFQSLDYYLLFSEFLLKNNDWDHSFDFQPPYWCLRDRNSRKKLKICICESVLVCWSELKWWIVPS